jgi:CheY-like chemotaxis protein
MAEPEKKKLLIVDDDQFLRDMMAAAFAEAGFAVTPAGDGQEAWDRLGAGYVPDVVLTGILMPRMSGFDLVRKMQSDQKLAPIPVAVFSHRGRDEDRQTAKELSVDEFIIQGSVPLVEIVRRVRALTGDVRTYRIYLKRFHDDAEFLLQTLAAQGKIDLAELKDDTCFLELTPQQENATFSVKVVTQPKTILGS